MRRETKDTTQDKRLKTETRDMKTIVVIPTYDEKDNVRPMAEAVLKLNSQPSQPQPSQPQPSQPQPISYEVLFVDDNSPDGTGAIIDEMSKDDPRIHCLHRTKKEGLGRAYIAGFEKALELGAERVVQMDCDFSHDPKDLPRLVEATNTSLEIKQSNEEVAKPRGRDALVASRMDDLSASDAARAPRPQAFDTTVQRGSFKPRGRDALVASRMDDLSASDAARAPRPQAFGTTVQRGSFKPRGRDALVASRMDDLSASDAARAPRPQAWTGFATASNNQTIKQFPDLVIGSRYVKGGATPGWPFKRRLISRAGGIFIRLVTGMPLRDPTGGFKCWKASTLRALDLPSIASAGYSFQLEMNHRTWKRGFAIREIPITFRDREQGYSKITPGIAVESIKIALKLRFA